MILIEFMDPIIVDSFPEREDINPANGFELKNAPYFISHLNKKPFVLPKDWTGCLFGTEFLISKLQTAANIGKISNIRYLKKNEPTSIKLSDTNTIEVTMFSTDHVNDAISMILFQDMYIKCFYTSCLGNFADEFVHNALLRKSIKSGIDILYIDDTVFGNDKSNDSIHPTEYQLGSLVYLVRPKEVIGMFGKDIPLYIKEFCENRDCFKHIS